MSTQPCFCRLFLIYWLSYLASDSVQCHVFHQEISGNGFHRTLSYSAEVKVEEGNSSFIIKQRFPVDLFLDIDEIENLTAFDGPKVITEPAFDTERPSFEAQEHMVWIQPTKYTSQGGIILFNVSLPIHVRYQRPLPTGSKASIYIENGKLYATSTKANFDFEFLNEYCKDVNDDRACQLKFVQEFSQVQEKAAFEIPTGNTDHAMFVTLLTLSTTSLASLLVLYNALHCQ